ncbi:gliding motility lipoprotein GldB [Bacteroides sp. 51]|uniref:gliding motility protein GldB-related protein n=1 Tax=Bacteroides sp. 51 TaxID=2302938 RepID=UPI0013D758D2|nr:gliding motility lipoprotein GldB [Bacteroides sp. 51]NDV81238.1 gliding motility lipoprotein GldB [Bacteroides sp. 51]
MKARRYSIFLLAIVLLAACWVSVGDLNDYADNDDISVARYDRLQNEYARFNSVSALQKMNTTYGRPTQILVEEILTIGSVSDSDINEKIKAFYSDSTLLQLVDDVEAKFADLDDVENELNKGFKRLQKELPSLIIPTVYAQVSALNESIVVADSLLGISLDKYMGEDYPLYNRYYYDYQCRSMRPDRIVPDCFTFYLIGGYPLPPLTDWTLLERMIRQGQIYYVVQQALGYKSISDVIGYSAVEEKWWLENCSEVWEYLVRNRMLASTDPMVVRRLMYPAPSTSFFGENSPAFIGVCMGAEIVSSYMKKNKKVTLEELLHTTNYQEILMGSGYTTETGSDFNRKQ